MFEDISYNLYKLMKLSSNIVCKKLKVIAPALYEIAPTLCTKIFRLIENIRVSVTTI